MFALLCPRTESKQIEDFVLSLGPVIQLVRHPKLSYKCLACRTATQRDGKVGSLGSGKANLLSAKHFLSQHLETPTHQKNFAKWSGKDCQTEEPEGKVNNGNQPRNGDATGPCQGYVVCSSASGTLGLFKDEFRLWATNCKLSVISKHKYIVDASQEQYICRHEMCTGKAMCGTTLCRACEHMGEPKGPVQRLVMKFAAKYNAAMLLNKRLFYEESEATGFAEMVSKSAWGRRSDLWNKLVQSSSADLQMYVRKSFSYTPISHRTQSLNQFMDSVVMPSISVHVQSIDNQMVTLFGQYTRALCGQHLSAFWQHWKRTMRIHVTHLDPRFCFYSGI